MHPLSALCLSRLGFDPAELPPDQLKQNLGRIIAVVAERQRELDQLATEVVSKSAIAIVAYGQLTPNPGITRDESLAVGESAAPNEDMDSIFPF